MILDESSTLGQGRTLRELRGGEVVVLLDPGKSGATVRATDEEPRGRSNSSAW
jgi:hypothetical protein